MANILSLAMKINADSSGFKLDPVEKALRALGAETDKVASIFDKFTATSDAAVRAQDQTRASLEALTAARKAGTINAQEFEEQFKAIKTAAESEAQSLQRAAEITKQFTNAADDRAAKLKELETLLEQGKITEDIYAAAVAEASGANAAAAEAEKQRLAALAEAERQRQAVLDEGARLTAQLQTKEEDRAKSLARVEQLLSQGAITEETAARARRVFSGEADAAAEADRRLADQKQAAARIIEANLSSVERAQRAFDIALKETQELERAGLLTKEQANAETARQTEILNKAAKAASDSADATEKQALKFNELSGVFAVLPGPLGDIAGRISGLASAGEGLSRVFSGGLSAGISGIATSITSLANPFTLAAAGIAAFGAAAAAVVNGLLQLEDRVEKLGITADKLGTSFEFVQVLDEAARRTGTSIDAVDAAFVRLQKSVTGVDEESKTAAAALSTIGVTAEQLQALAPEEQYKLIGERLAAIEDPAKRSATATQLFGKSGADLIPFFNNLEKAEADMAKFGATISSIDRGRIDNLGNAFDEIGTAIQGLGQNALLPFAGLVEGVTKTLSAVINVISLVADAIGAVLTPVLDAVGAAFGAFGDAVNGTIGFFRSFFTTAEETSKATGSVSESVKRSAEEMDKLGKAISAGNDRLDDIIKKSGEFGQAGFDAAFKFQQALKDLGEQVDEENLTAEQYARGVANATAEYDRQIGVIQQVAEQNKKLAEEARRLAEAETKRVDDLLAKQQPIDELARDIVAANNEIIRTEAALAEARAAGAEDEVKRLTQRLANLDQLQASLVDRSDEAAQGFSEGFDKAFANVDKGIGGLIDKASEFGNEGAIAASQLTEGIEAAKQAVKDGILNREAFEAEVARQKELFEDRVKGLQEAAKITEQLYAKEADLLDKQFEIERDRAVELASIRAGAIKIQDIREGGISSFFEALKEDPAIGEAKKQTKELQKIRDEIAKLQAEKVEILAGTG